MKEPRSLNTLASPSPRQLEVLASYLQRGTVREAADALGLSPSTVKNHLSSIYEELNVGSAHEAARVLGWLRIPAYEPCGWVGSCMRPRGHVGHHGGWAGVRQGGMK